jgi:hypothetical protein
MQTEFAIDASFVQAHQVGSSLDGSLFEGVDSFKVT